MLNLLDSFVFDTKICYSEYVFMALVAAWFIEVLVAQTKAEEQLAVKCLPEFPKKYQPGKHVVRRI